MAQGRMSRKAKAEEGDDKENELIDAGEIFSDESSFYGDAETKLELEQRVATYDPKTYWDVREWNVQYLATQGSHQISRGVKRKWQDDPDFRSRKLDVDSEVTVTIVREVVPDKPVAVRVKSYNPMEGEHMAKQLEETLDDFLHRLKPSTTTISAGGPWIWIANPYSPRRPSNEDVAGFRQEGTKAMNDYLVKKVQFETQYPHKNQSTITRMLKPDRGRLEARIIQLAKEKGVTCGKWMLFPYPDRVDAVWAIVAKAIVENELGCTAKVATDDGDPKNTQRLICVYTGDFSDVRDVKRVLSRMQQLGLIVDGERPIYYKADAYTHLDIMSGNEFKLKASMYSSTDLFAEMRLDLR